jgi:tungstate transport system substrate-binding protein
VEALASNYPRLKTGDISIDWVCNHSRNTQLALLHGYIDIGLTYERDQEAITAAEGWSITAGCAFHDHFCLAGPASNPANIQPTASLEAAFLKIAESKVLFHSRADASATMWKERAIWTRSGIEPWKDTSAAIWYQTNIFSPSEALKAADAAGAYLLTDRSTLLRQTALQTIHSTTVFIEPKSAEDVLMNSCYALIPAHVSGERFAAALHFLDYLFSQEGQRVIAAFGKEELGGFPLFASVGDGFAKSFLRGGLPCNGKWKLLETRDF